MEAYTTSMEVNLTFIEESPTVMELYFLPCKLMKVSMKVAERFHGIFYRLPFKCNLVPWK